MKIKEFFKSQRAIKVTILVVTFIVVVGIVKLIYFFDQPKFIPEETRGKVREGVKEDIVKPLEKIIPPLAKVIQNAAYKPPESSGQASQNGAPTSSGATDTSNWQTYRNEKYGYELKYPEGLKKSENQNSASFWKSEDYQQNQNGIFPEFSIDTISSDKSAQSWVSEKNNPPGFISDISDYKRGANTWVKALEAGDPDHYIYVISVNGKIYQIITSIEAPEYIDELLEKFSTF